METFSSSLINAHPESVRLLLKKYGVTAEPSPEVLDDCIKKFKEPFLHDLFEIEFNAQYSDFSPEAAKTKLLGGNAISNNIGVIKSTKWDGFKNKFKDTFQGATDILKGLSTVTNTANQIINPEKDNKGDKEQKEKQEAIDKEKKKKQTQIFIIVAIVVILLIIAAVFLIPKK